MSGKYNKSVKKLVCAGIIGLVMAGLVQAQIIYVDDDGPADFNNIQAAINDANNGDTIIVHPGIYSGPNDLSPEVINFLGKNIILTGTDPTNSDVVNSTIIRGIVRFDGTEEPICRFTGFRIYDPFFGAIHGNHTHATISFCAISSNGPCCATVIKDCDGTIRNCVITDNFTNWRCGIDPIILGCHGLIKNCTIANNISGAGVLDGSTTTIENCIIYNNLYGYQNPQISIGSGATLNISYCDMRDGLEGIYLEDPCNCTVNWGPGNIDTDPYFVQLGHWEEDPRQLTGGDYHLKSEAGRWEPSSQNWVQDDVTSPCIDAGNRNSPIGLEPFPNGGVINMGAYGGTAEASKSYFGEPVCETIVAGDINGDCNVDFRDLAFMAYHWLEDIGAFDPNSIIRDGIEYYIHTDKSVYELGEHTEILFRIANLTDEEWWVSGLGYVWDILVEAKQGENFREVWRFGWEHSPPPGPGGLRLQPGESWELRVPWPQFSMTRTGDPWDYAQAPPGTYRITGVLDAYRTRPEPPMEIHSSVSVDITVEY